MTVHVGVIVATRRRSSPEIIRIIRVSGARWAILIGHPTTRRRTAISSLTPIVKLARWSASAVVVATGAVASRRPAAIVVVVVGSGWVSTAAAAAAAHGRAGSVSIAAPVIRTTRATVRSTRLEWRRWGWIRDILDACHFLALELTAVQLLHCGLEVGSRLILDESTLC
jgi:hypothetical protein